MLLSMTGYGAAAGQVEGVEYAVELRSVNNRYLKPVIRLPEAWSQAEMDVEKVLRGHVQRGTVTLTVRMRLPEDQAAMKVNAAVVSGYLRQLRPLAEQFGQTAHVDLGAMLQLPGVCEPPEFEELRQRSRGRLMELIEQGVLGLVEMRRREGTALLADLLSNCDVIANAMESVKKLSPMVVREYQQRLAQRVAELLSGGTAKLDQDQLAREVAVFAERCDVAEEVARLGQHVEQFRQVATKEPSAGRKLEFIAQEMLREANTIGSKAASGDIVRTVVDIKTAIDRIKEQVQNVE